jgi:valine dehydrogenase (NAD+)
MADRDHIAITTGDTSTTRSKVSSQTACPGGRETPWVAKVLPPRWLSHGTVRTGIRWISHRVDEDPDRTGRVTTVTQVFATSDHESGSSAHFGHEQVILCQDPPTGLRAIVAIYSTALGPALGGTRFYPYQSEAQALADVLNLSRAMTYKSALAGLDLGGGKAVIIGDPRTLKSEPLLRAYGRFIESLGGRYITACDVGTYSEDMDIIARECRHVTGRTVPYGGAGDSSVLTAFGVFQGMRAAAEHAWGSASLEGRRVGVEGVGKVGARLVDHLAEAGADVVICDVDPRAVERVRDRHPGVSSALDHRALIARPLDVLAPCALGGTLDDDTVGTLTARIVCGAANNQLAHPGIEKMLADRGVLYAPDYLVNSGGLIQVADELEGFNFDRAKGRAEKIFDTTHRIFTLADEEGVPPAVAADRLAERRMSEVGRLRGIWLPG